MKIQLHKLTIAAPLAAASLFGGAIAAEAADLTGPGVISINGQLEILGYVDPLEGASLSFDFQPPVDSDLNGPGIGDNDPALGDGIYGVGFVDPASDAGGFEEFIPDATNVPPAFGTIGSGLVKDVNLGGNDPVAIILDTVGGTLASVPEFLILQSNADGAAGVGTDDWSFTAESFAEPEFFTVDDPVDGIQDSIGTLQVQGFWVSPDGDKFLDGTGVFSVQFENETQDDLANAFAAGDSRTQTFSATFTAEVAQVPESTSMVGLACALGLGAFSLKKKKKPDNLV